MSEALLTGDLQSAPVYMDMYSNDPVFHGRYIYKDGCWEWVGKPSIRPRPASPDNEAIPPECTKECKWRQSITFDLQRNALRLEISYLVEKYRCGWNLRPGVMGGRPLDYEPCIYTCGRF